MINYFIALYVTQVVLNNRNARELEINPVESIYIHFPFCRHLCNYCDFHKKVLGKNSDVDKFQKYLRDSIPLHRTLLKKNDSFLSDIDTLYIGGGTPSLWGAGGVDFLLELFNKEKISFKEDYEFTMELNPGSWKKSDLIELQKLGVNRLSIGVQSLSKKTLRALDRVHSVDDVYKTLEVVSELGFNFSVDFMLGLPAKKSGRRDIISEVEKILSFEASHMSAYILTVNKNYIHYSDLPNEDFIYDEYLQLSDYMTDKGFDHYEVSNFSKKGFRSRHNLKYWRGQSVAALGPSATGFLKSGSMNGLRYKWKTIDCPEFTKESISNDDYKLERFFLQIRLLEGINLKEYIHPDKERSALNFINELDNKGHLLSSEFDNLSLSPRGFLCADSITTRFLSMF